MKKNVEKFYSLLMENPEEVSKIQEEVKKIRDEKDLMNYMDSKIIPLAREKGFEFTKEDLLSYEKKAVVKLSEEDLLNVNGGIYFPNKKIASLFLAGISLTSNLQQGTYAMGKGTPVLSYSDILVSSSNQGATDEDPNIQTADQDQGAQEEEEGTLEGVEEFSISKDDVREGKIEIPEGVKKLTIEAEAFQDSQLETFKIPEDIEELNIGEKAFSNSKLTKIIFPNNITKIDDGAFAGCENLKIVGRMEGEIGDVYIRSRAFAECTNLNVFTIENGKVYFEEDAFSGCEKLSNVKFPWEGERAGNRLLYKAFKGTPYCNVIGDVK